MASAAKRKAWDKEAMIRAVTCVRNGEMGYLKASKLFEVPKRSLERYVKDKTCTPVELVGIHLGRRSVLSSQLEDELVQPCHGRTFLCSEIQGHKNHGISVSH